MQIIITFFSLTIPTVQTQVDVHVRSQPLTFTEDMSSEQLALWLRNHPSLSEAEYEEDISKLRGTLPDTVLIIMLVTILYSSNNFIALFRCQD